MRTSGATVLVAVLALVGCDPVPFASVELSLRVPDGDADRLRPPSCDDSPASCLQLSRVLDGDGLEALTLSNEFWGPTKPLPLGQRARVLELELFTGAPDGPAFLARADPVVIPAIGDGSDVTLARTAVLGAYDAVEQLFTDAPVAAASGTACADGVGNAWFLGNSAWSFSARDLEPRELDGISASASASVACAGHAELPDDVDDPAQATDPLDGRLYAFVGDCGGAGGGTLFAGTDVVADSTRVDEGSGCDALVALRDDVLWLVQSDRVTLHDSATLGTSGARATSPAQPFVDAVVRSDGALVVAEAAGGTRLYSVTGTSTVVEQLGPNLTVARFVTIDGHAWALTTSSVLRSVDVETAPDQQPDFAGLTDIRDAVALRDGTLIALGTGDDDGTPIDAVAVAGAGHVVPALVGHGRTALTATVGGAVLLWGGVAGVDVFVPSAPTLLAVRPAAQ